MNVIVGFSCNSILLWFFSYFLKSIFSQILSKVTNVDLCRVIINFKLKYTNYLRSYSSGSTEIGQ